MLLWSPRDQSSRSAPEAPAVLNSVKQNSITLNVPAVDCTVRALSDSGAELAVVSTAGIPDNFKLLVAADGFARSCAIVRKMNRRLEVAFGGV
jgi:hypothetical protein